MKAAAAQWESEASMQDEPAPDIGPDNSLLILDDDASFRTRLSRAMEKRGFAPVMAESVAEGLAACRADPPAYAVVDLRLEDGNGLDVVKALLSDGADKPPPPENPMSADRVRWEHIQRVFELCDRNVSETARRLNMHRRTLQRILAKRSPR